jgi:hypothetical protein
MEEIGGGSISSNGVVMKKEGLGFSKRGIKIENPFAFKALQVFTGFGVGCGVGIGSGAPLNLGSIPMVGEIMNSARGATNVFSGATHHVNGAVQYRQTCSCSFLDLPALCYSESGCVLAPSIVAEAWSEEHSSRCWLWSWLWSWFRSWHCSETKCHTQTSSFYYGNCIQLDD